MCHICKPVIMSIQAQLGQVRHSLVDVILELPPPPLKEVNFHPQILCRAVQLVKMLLYSYTTTGCIHQVTKHSRIKKNIQHAETFTTGLQLTRSKVSMHVTVTSASTQRRKQLITQSHHQCVLCIRILRRLKVCTQEHVFNKSP